MAKNARGRHKNFGQSFFDCGQYFFDCGQYFFDIFFNIITFPAVTFFRKSSVKIIAYSVVFYFFLYVFKFSLASSFSSKKSAKEELFRFSKMVIFG